MILQCIVRLGDCIRIHKNGDQTLNFAVLQRQGVDSVCLPGDKGVEY